MHYSVELVDEDQRIWSATYNNGVAVHNPLVQQFRTNWYESPETNLMCLTRKILEDTLRKKLYLRVGAGRQGPLRAGSIDGEVVDGAAAGRLHQLCGKRLFRFRHDLLGRGQDLHC
jgi:hypothetical protein